MPTKTVKTATLFDDEHGLSESNVLLIQRALAAAQRLRAAIEYQGEDAGDAVDAAIRNFDEVFTRLQSIKTFAVAQIQRDHRRGQLTK